ncbi:hypothetical protein J6590_095588 [Homalodisca vitripennis]|nr:hypothetical protein J6590_065605 [Homalodisca vitripennis]KAG8324298.1 hypothetical protein J6590_095588 [Homalodisca vitripennis]
MTMKCTEVGPGAGMVQPGAPCIILGSLVLHCLQHAGCRFRSYGLIPTASRTDGRRAAAHGGVVEGGCNKLVVSTNPGHNLGVEPHNVQVCSIDTTHPTALTIAPHVRRYLAACSDVVM